MKQRKINLALQVLPQSETRHPYEVVDAAIEIIQQSGLKYKVCPFETVIEGTLEEALQVVEQVHQACYKAGADRMMTYIKIQSDKDQDVFIEDKMEKYK